MNIRRCLPVIAIVILGCLIITVASAVYYSITVQSRGKIKGIGVGIYADAEASIVVSEIDWGILEPGGSANLTVYIKNEGNVVANLTLTTEAWTPPEAEESIGLTWDYDGTELDVSEIRCVTFTLAIDPSIIGINEFSFDIVVTAVG